MVRKSGVFFFINKGVPSMEHIFPKFIFYNIFFYVRNIRINQRILGTNKFLYKIKVKDNAFCTFCQEDEETIEHLFWNCETVQAFIDEIDSWLLSNGVSIPFTMHFFLFGVNSVL
jgi:hypothetical protein